MSLSGNVSNDGSMGVGSVPTKEDGSSGAQGGIREFDLDCHAPSQRLHLPNEKPCLYLICVFNSLSTPRAEIFRHAEGVDLT